MSFYEYELNCVAKNISILEETIDYDDDEMVEILNFQYRKLNFWINIQKKIQALG